MHPYDEGFTAFIEDDIECPYTEGTEDWDTWHIGYEDAMAENYEELERSDNDKYEESY